MKGLLITVILLLLPWIPYESQAEPQPIVIAASEWAPYTSPDLTEGGFLTEIVTTALSRAGYRPTVEFVPWKRGVQMTQRGKYDALLGASYTETRTAYFYYPKYAWKSYIFFFERTGLGRQYHDVEDLCPAILGVFRGSFYLNRFSAVGCLTLEEVSGIRQLIQMLYRKRIDLFIDSKDAVDYALKTQLPEYKDKIEPVQPYFEVDKIYLVISRQHPQYRQIAADFDRGIDQIKSDGTYQTILDRHGIHQMANEEKSVR